MGGEVPSEGQKELSVVRAALSRSIRRFSGPSLHRFLSGPRRASQREEQHDADQDSESEKNDRGYTKQETHSRLCCVVHCLPLVRYNEGGLTRRSGQGDFIGDRSRCDAKRETHVQYSLDLDPAHRSRELHVPPAHGYRTRRGADGSRWPEQLR